MTKTKTFLPEPKRCVLDVRTPRGEKTSVCETSITGECRSDVSAHVMFDMGGEVMDVATVAGNPRRSVMHMKHIKKDSHEFVFLFGKGRFKVVRADGSEVHFTLSADGLEVTDGR